MANLTTPLAGPQTSPLFENLPAGDYRVRIISSKACAAEIDETITEPTPLDIGLSLPDFTCAPDNTVGTPLLTVAILDGLGTPGVPSGTGPYLYSLDNTNFQTANTFAVNDTGVAQTFTVYVRDAQGCTTSESITIQPLNTFSASVVQDVAITCVNEERVTVSVNQLAAPGDVYDVSLLPAPNANGTLVSSTDTTATFDLNSVGSYTFRVTNTNTGCYVDTATYTIAPYDLIEARIQAITPVTCFGDANGALELQVSDYLGAFDYEIFRADGTAVATGFGLANANPFTMPLNGLSGGNYYVTVTETGAGSSLCSAITNTATIVSPDAPLVATTTILAEPTCTDDQGAISIIPDGGYPPYDIQMTHSVSGQGYSALGVTSIAFSDLASGTFTISLTDSRNCVVTVTETMAAATPIVASATPLVTDLACFGDNGATVSAVVTGGGSGTYGYQLNYYDAAGTTIEQSTASQTSPDFTDLGAGIYSITVSDGWNCDMETNTVVVREPDPISTQLIRTSALTCTTGVELVLSATGGSGSYEYSTDNLTFLPMTANPMPLPATGVLALVSISIMCAMRSTDVRLPYPMPFAKMPLTH